MKSSRRLVIAAAIGAAVIAVAAVSDFLVRSFWSRHAMLTSLVASLIVLAVTVAVLNEWLDRRDRRRWSVLAQFVLFQLVQSARVTWTSLVELLDRREIEDGSRDELIAAADRARDTPAMASATHALLADAGRRRALQQVVAQLTQHSRSVIVSWASVMVGAGPYTDLFDSHVELQSRLDWLSEYLTRGEAADERTLSEAKLARSSVAIEQADRFGSDDRLANQVVTAIQLAVRLDFESRQLALSIVPTEWWEARTVVAISG